MTASLRFGLAACVALLAHAACEYPEFHYRGDGTGSTSMSSATGGAGGSTSSSSSMATGGEGGATDCELGVLGVCGGEQKCTVNPATKAIGCDTAGPFAAWHKCDSDADCKDGTWCDAPFKVCKPLCKGAADCNFQAQGTCIDAVSANGQPIHPGVLKHCVPNCDPKTGAPCDTANSVTCLLRDTDFDCAKSAGKVAGETCSDSSECKAGSTCITVNDSAVCSRWCADPGLLKLPHPDCGGFDAPVCYGLTQSIMYKGVEYGACGPI